MKKTQPKTAEWLYDKFLKVYKCSFCGAIKGNYFVLPDDELDPIRFCPSCGKRIAKGGNNDCNRSDCEYNDDGFCEIPNTRTLNEEGTCNDYVAESEE